MGTTLKVDSGPLSSPVARLIAYGEGVDTLNLATGILEDRA